MRSQFPSPSIVPFVFAALLATAGVARADSATDVDALRQRFPAGSIDSVDRADAALAATNGAKVRVEKDYKDAARACIAKVLVNACVDEARSERRRRNGDIDAVELEANRFKRRDRADRAEADRTKREADRAASAPADAAQRERNRKAYDDKQAEAARSAADRTRADATRSTPGGRPHGATVKLGPLAGSEPTAEQRAKNAADLAKRQQVAALHAKDIDRRLVEKAAERKRRDDAKAAKDAKAAAAAQAAMEAARSGVP